MNKPNTKRRLARSSNRLMAGVCGGIAEFIGWNPAAVRGLWVFGLALTAVIPGIVMYTILAFVMPPPSANGFDLDQFRVQ